MTAPLPTNPHGSTGHNNDHDLIVTALAELQTGTMKYAGAAADSTTYPAGSVVRQRGGVYVATSTMTETPMGSIVYPSDFTDAAKWDPNGSTSTLTSTSALLTTGTSQAGDIVTTDETIVTDGLFVIFQADAPAGADGFGLAFFDPANSSSASVGGASSSVGVAGVWGFHVRFLTWSTNQIQVWSDFGSLTQKGSISFNPHAYVYTWAVWAIKTATGVYTVRVLRDDPSSGMVSFTQIMEVTGVPGTDTCSLAFGAGTGGTGGNQTIKNVEIRRRSSGAWQQIGSYTS